MMKKILLLGFTLPLLTACGFTPMHAPGGFSGGMGFGDVAIEVTRGIDEDAGDREIGFYVQQRLRDRIGENQGRHVLKLTPSLRRQRLGINADDVASRYDSILVVSYKLIEFETGDVLTKGQVKAASTFGAPTDPYGIVAADKNAKQQTAKELADRLLIKLAAYYSEAE
jgi:LPS-assembly lipoprotein